MKVTSSAQEECEYRLHVNYVGTVQTAMGGHFWIVFHRSSTEAIQFKSPRDLRGIDQVMITVAVNNPQTLDGPVQLLVGEGSKVPTANAEGMHPQQLSGNI